MEDILILEVANITSCWEFLCTSLPFSSVSTSSGSSQEWHPKSQKFAVGLCPHISNGSKTPSYETAWYNLFAWLCWREIWDSGVKKLQSIVGFLWAVLQTEWQSMMRYSYNKEFIICTSTAALQLTLPSVSLSPPSCSCMRSVDHKDWKSMQVVDEVRSSTHYGLESFLFNSVLITR